MFFPPEPKPNKEPLMIAATSSHTCTKPNVTCLCQFYSFFMFLLLVTFLLQEPSMLRFIKMSKQKNGLFCKIFSCTNSVGRFFLIKSVSILKVSSKNFNKYNRVKGLRAFNKLSNRQIFDIYKS